MVAMQEDKYTRPLVSFQRHQDPGPSFIMPQLDTLGCNGSQLFELLAVRVHTRPIKEVTALSTLSHLEIYGRIVLVDELGNKYCLFKRKKSKAKTVFLPDDDDAFDTSVTILHNFDIESPRCLPGKFCLNFRLKDKLRDIVIVNDCKLIDCTQGQGVTYDRVRTFCFHREQKSEPDCRCLPLVSVDYAVFRCAVLACVSVELVNDTRIEGGNNRTDHNSDGSDFVPAKVFGRITSTTKTTNVECIERLLFDETDELYFEASNKLSTFSVPSYSLLEIQVNVEVEGQTICKTVKFRPDSWSCSPYCADIHGKPCRIRVFAHFGLASVFLPEYPMYEYYYDAKKLSEEKLFQNSSNRKRPRGHQIRKASQQAQLLETLNNIEWGFCIEMTEIFSISICSYGVDGLRSGLKGQIRVCDEYQRFIIFDGCKDSDTLCSYETLKIRGSSRCYTGDYFSIMVELEDGTGRNICFGRVFYDFTNISYFYNTRICSIVHGMHGFAILHYTIFSDAIQAKLRFTLKPCSYGKKETAATHCKVYGRISTRYDNFRYVTHYEKKHYESTLFEKGESEAEETSLGEIPLLKSVVAVPRNASLIILADLYVLLDGGRVETLEYKRTFEPEKPEFMYDEFQGSDFCLRAYVNWTRFPDYDPRYCSYIDT